MARNQDSFDKYDQHDAYHWNMTDPRWSNGKYNPPTEARFKVLEDLLPSNIGRVLDIGCGDGYLLHRIGSAYPEADLYGIDYENQAIKLAEDYLDEHGHQSALSQGSAYELPYEDAYFDTVVMTEVIEHLEDPDRSLSEAKRVLQSGGTFLVTTPNRQSDFMWDREYHVQEFSYDELKAVVSKYFERVSLSACCPMGWMRFWRSRSLNRSIVRSVSRLGYNPMLKSSNDPGQNFGQLLVECKKK